MQIEEWLKRTAGRIPRLDAELILMAYVETVASAGVDRSWLAIHGEWEIPDEWLEVLEKMVRRRAEGEPLAYILGTREFYGREFKVNSAVLIPRPETEGVVDLALEVLRGDLRGVQAQARSESGLRAKGVSGGVRVLEIGTGSGCIAITLALEMKIEMIKGDFGASGISAAPRVGIEVVATDISGTALEVARENARNLGAKVRFYQGDLLGKSILRYLGGAESDLGGEVGYEGDSQKMAEYGDLEGSFDVLVANLPYVDPEWGWIDRKSLDFEPEEALYAPKQGLGAYERLLAQLVQTKVARMAVFEIDPCQRLEMRKMVEKYGMEVVKVEGYGVVVRAI